MSEQINLKAELGRMIAGSFYDHQEVRITEFNRVRDIIRRRMENIPMVGSVEEKKEDSKKSKNKFIDKKIPEYLEQLNKEGKISKDEKFYIERILEVQKNAEKFENEYKKLMGEFVENEILYKEFLGKIKGISAILSANMLKEFGYCEQAPYISSLWKYVGMHVEEGEAPTRKKGEKLSFNSKLRTLCYKISDSFVKQRTPFYRDIYDKEKERQVGMMNEVLNNLSKEQEKELKKIKKRKEKRDFFNQFNPKAPVSLLNAEMRARRKMVKIFLAHYWQASKELSQGVRENQYRVAKPYVEEKLNHKHISNWREAVEKQ